MRRVEILCGVRLDLLRLRHPGDSRLIVAVNKRILRLSHTVIDCELRPPHVDGSLLLLMNFSVVVRLLLRIQTILWNGGSQIAERAMLLLFGGHGRLADDNVLHWLARVERVDGRRAQIALD